MLRCAILDDYQGVALEMADWASLPEVEPRVFREPIGDRSALAQALAPFEIIVAMRERTAFDRMLLERLPALRLLVTTGSRNASIDVAAAAERGVTVCGTRGWPGPAAELTWALILALARDLPREVADFRSVGGWQKGIGRSLRGAMLGVVGVGNLGRRVIAVARAFEMNVVGWSRSLTPQTSAELGIVHAPSLAALLPQADIVTVHLTLTPQTRGLIGAPELAAMKSTAYLLNTSRGPIVDEAALVAALRDRRIAGAALDVFDREPLPARHPFRSLPNVIATPHIGYVTRENYRVFYGDAVEDIRAWLAGAPLRVLSADPA